MNQNNGAVNHRFSVRHDCEGTTQFTILLKM